MTVGVRRGGIGACRGIIEGGRLLQDKRVFVSARYDVHTRTEDNGRGSGILTWVLLSRGLVR
jgi:hypothetical protein